MTKLPFKIDLGGKTAVVTGAGGVLCGGFAKTLAACGAKVALLDLNLEAAQAVADDIGAEGGTARAYKANVLEREPLEAVAGQVLADLGGCDILINGAGGNNPRATTDKEYYEPGDLDAETKSFFDLDPAGVEFVFNLNFIGTLIPTQDVYKRQLLLAIIKNGLVLMGVSSYWQNLVFGAILVLSLYVDKVRRSKSGGGL